MLPVGQLLFQIWNQCDLLENSKWQKRLAYNVNTPANVVGFYWKVVGIEAIGQLAFHTLRLPKGFYSSLSSLSLPSFCSYYFFSVDVTGFSVQNFLAH